MARSIPVSGSECCCKTTLGTKNNCFVNVSVFYLNIRVQLYPLFPINPIESGVLSETSTQNIACHCLITNEW